MKKKEFTTPELTLFPLSVTDVLTDSKDTELEEEEILITGN